MNNHLHLEVLTAERKILATDVSECSFPTAHCGYYGILPGHTPLVTQLGDGLITYLHKEQKQVLTVFGGFAEVQPDKITILAGESETPAMLNASDLEQAKTEALKTLKESKDQETLDLAQKALEMVNIRLQALESK